MTLVAAAASAVHWLARPHLFTMLFTVVFLSVLERVERQPGSYRRLCLLPLLMVLWTNLHGGFFVGIILICAYAAGELAVLLRASEDGQRRQALGRARLYLLTAAGCAVATFVNPYFYRLHAHIFTYLADGFYRHNVMEFQSLNFQTGQAVYIEILLAAGAAAAFWRLRRGNFTWPLLFAAWAHLALYSTRNVEIFVLLAAAPAAELLSEVLRRAPGWRVAGWLRLGLESFGDFTRECDAFDDGPRWHVSSCAAILVLAAFTYAPQPPPACRAAYNPKAFPVRAADQMEKAGLFGGVFTEDLWGGYLIYRLYPDVRVFWDGRVDFYGTPYNLAAIDALRGQRLPLAIEVLAFSEEEGVRFGAPYLGSKAVCGRFEPELLERTDAAGVSVAAALRNFGLDPGRLAAAAYPPDQVLGYLEAHIEQGPILETRKLPLGVVESIVGQSRLWLRFMGKAGHAGTLPMELRQDALAAAGEFVVAVEQHARSVSGLRATVGALSVYPGAVNVVPGSVRLSLDVRHAQDSVREKAAATLLENAATIGRRRGLGMHVESAEHHGAVAADPHMTDCLVDAAQSVGYDPLRMVSGAGHDAGVMATLAPMTMLFLRSPGGISHHPDEAVALEDVRAALAVMVAFLLRWNERPKACVGG